jgi:hypothetical protein
MTNSHPTVTQVRDVNVGADGYPINHRHNERAGILSTIMFLERMVREQGVTQELRAEARFQADFLRHLVRKRVRDGADTLDGALREALEQLMAPPPKQLAAPTRQLPPPDEVIDA